MEWGGEGNGVALECCRSGVRVECCGSRVEWRWSGEERGEVLHWSVVGVGWKWNEVAVEWNGSRTGSGVMG